MPMQHEQDDGSISLTYARDPRTRTASGTRLRRGVRGMAKYECSMFAGGVLPEANVVPKIHRIHWMSGGGVVPRPARESIYVMPDSPPSAEHTDPFVGRMGLRLKAA